MQRKDHRGPDQSLTGHGRVRARSAGRQFSIPNPDDLSTMPLRSNHPTILVVAAAATFSAADLSAQVTEWAAFKAKIYRQESNAAPTTVDFCEAGVFLRTTNPGDAGLITLSGGNIAGALPLEQDGTEWELDLEFETLAAMNAVIPDNATYTLTMTGGALGIVTQTFSIGAAVYPVTPYLTGNSFATAEQYPAGSATTMTWNNPGGLAPGGWVGITAEDRSGNEVHGSVLATNATSDTIPANALAAGDCHYGWIEFVNGLPTPAGGFGLPGKTLNATITDFEIRTWPFATPGCASQQELGTGCVGMAMVSSEPILGSSWDLQTFGLTPGALAFTFFAFGPQEPGLPLVALGINAPGCTSQIDLASVVTNLGGLANPSGDLNVSVNLPADPSLGGVLFYAQTVATTPLTPAGLGTSNSVEARLGS